MLNSSHLNVLGESLFDALNQRYSIAPLVVDNPQLTIEDAYQISLHFLSLRKQQNHERVVGKKIGVTSAVVQEMLGVFQPDFGFLTDAMVCEQGRIDTNMLIQPRAEAEIAFVLKHTLPSEAVTSAQVLMAVDVAIPAFEIVDSRIDNWAISIVDTVADNASCGVYILGDERFDPQGIDFENIKATVTKNNQFLSEGKGSAVLGNPLNAVAWLANTLGKYGVRLEAGETILSGSMVPLEPAKKGDEFHLQLEDKHGNGLGDCRAVFV